MLTDLERLLSPQLVHSERVIGSHHVLLCACKGFQSTMPGFMAWLAKSPLETVCLADWHISRLYLLQPVEETDLITTRNIHNASISRKGERRQGREKERERASVSCFYWFTQTAMHIHKQSRKSMHTQKHASCLFLAGDAVPESSLVFQFQSFLQPRSHTLAGN